MNHTRPRSGTIPCTFKDYLPRQSWRRKLPSLSLSRNMKMLAGVVAVTVCLVIMVTGGVLSQNEIDRRTDALLAHNLVSGYALKIARDAAQIQLTVRGYALSGDVASLAVYRDAEAELSRNIDLMLAVHGREQNYYDSLQRLRRFFGNLLGVRIKKALALREAYDANKAAFDDIESHFRDKESLQAVLQFDQEMQAVLEREEAYFVRAREAIDAAKQSAKDRLKLTSVMGGVMLLMICFGLYRESGANRELTQVCLRLATGDTSMRLTQNGSRDVVAIAVNAMIDSLHAAAETANSIAQGDLDVSIEVHGERDQLGVALRHMSMILRQSKAAQLKRAWQETGMAEFSASIRGDIAINDHGKRALGVIVRQLDAQVGALYFPGSDGKTLHLIASHAFTHRHTIGEAIDSQSGLLGQAIAEGEIVVVRRVPSDYLVIASGLGETAPRQVMLAPIVYQGELMGALELATLGEFTEDHVQWVRGILEPIAIVLQSAKARNRVRVLLEESQAQARQLAEQQEELQASNEELSEQTERLRCSEEELRTQSDSLQALNAELEEKNASLDRQKEAIDLKNRSLESIQVDLEARGRQLEISGKYKSEFLANMSHELRTPLNSLLLLSRSLLDNDTGNLDADQLESLDIIDRGGKDLLTLINDILDLSKVESGKLSVMRDEIRISDIADSMRSQFRKVAQNKNLDFRVDIGALGDAVFFSDIQRVEQILKNLLSNAHKFTNQGGVTLAINLTDSDATGQMGDVAIGPGISFAVHDTGIGIPPDKLRDVWEAFQQADGTTSRKFGGTGLGLTISRQLAKLLGGSIVLESVLGTGSVFTLHLPLDGLAESDVATRPLADHAIVLPLAVSLPTAGDTPLVNGNLFRLESTPNRCHDDRGTISAGVGSLLIIEDDADFARMLLERVRKRSFRGLVGSTGAEGLALAEKYLPQGIVLDLGLPDMDGVQVLEQLKLNLRTRHIPVHIVSARDKDPAIMAQGAVSFLKKPITAADISELFESISYLSGSGHRQLLIVEDSQDSATALQKLLKNSQTDIVVMYSGQAALDTCAANEFDCVILNLDLPDMTGEQVLKRLEEIKGALPPVIVYTGRDLTEAEYRNLQQYSGSVVVKGVHSPQRLLDEVSLFLHTVESTMPLRQRQQLRELHGSAEMLEGKKVLLVDDDVRNTFALSKLLTKQGMKVVMADDGKLAIEKLLGNPDIDIVLMDIMMPVMDGYEAMAAIRLKNEYRDLPIIALTAKAMTEDRKKCLDAGASDYLTKPVDIDKLTSIMRVWLSKSV
jgi:CheY-like chemotaxis protein/signal transduction histidine kinase